MSRFLCVVAVSALLTTTLFGQKPDSAIAAPGLTAEQIMARVAANQDRAEELRSHYAYSQHIHVISRNSHGKLLREEATDYVVAPAANTSSYTVKRFSGRYLKSGKYVAYGKEPAPDADSADASMVKSFRDDLTGKASAASAADNRGSDNKGENKGGNNKAVDNKDGSGERGVHIRVDSSSGSGKDGIATDLFPLTSTEQKQYAFQLAGRTTMNKHKVYHVVFRPRDSDDIDWAGDAYIDEQEFQPVFVTTRLSKKLPFFVRTMLGTDVPGLGFSVQYERQKDGVWFPSSFGSEFYVRALYFFKRNIAVSLKNSDFVETHVDAKVAGFSEVK